MRIVNRFFILMLSGFIAGCNFNKVERAQHEAAIDTELKVGAPDAREGVVKLAQKDLDSQVQQIYKKMTAKDYLGVAHDSYKMLTDPKRFQYLSLHNQISGDALLGYYNYSLLELLKQRQGGPELSNYKELALKGCSERLKACESITYLQRDPRSVVLITEILKAEESKLSVEEYYRLVGLGVEVNGRVRSVALENYYLKRGNEYFEFLDKKGSERKEDLDRHVRLFQLILTHFTLDPKDGTSRKWIEDSNPWKYSKSSRSSSVLGSNKLFALASAQSIYSGNHLTKSLNEAIENMKSTADGLGESFYSTVQSMSQKPIAAKALNRLKIETSEVLAPSFYNEYFFLIDRLYRGHLDLEEANLFWEGTRKDPEGFSKVLQPYVKIEFMKMVFRTFDYVVRVFQNSKTTNNQLFDEVINKSRLITDDWSQLLSRIQNIYNFVRPKSTEKESKFNQDLKFLSSINNTVKYFSIYPNMLAVGDIMIALQGEVKIKSFWDFDFTINPKEVMMQLIDGTVEKPWFIFGGDTAPLNKTELLVSFFFGSQAGLFDFFRQIKDENGAPLVSEEKFFANTIKRTLSEDTNRLTRAVEDLEQYVNNRKVDFESAAAVCAPLEKKNYDFSVQFDAEDLAKWSLFGTFDGFLIGRMVELFAGGPIGVFAEIRDAYESRLIQIKSMMEIIETNLEGEDAKKFSAALEKEVAYYEGIKKRFYQNSMALHRKVSTCLNEMMSKERERALDFYESESKFFSGVYFEAVKSLQNNLQNIGAGQPKPTNNLRIDNGYFVYTEWDLLQRLMATSALLKPKVVFNEPRKESKDALALHLFRVPFFNSDTAKLLSQEEFVSYALRGITSQDTTRFAWLKKTGNLHPLTLKLRNMMDLYNMGFDLEKQKSKVDRITVEEILKEGAFYLSHIGISDREAKVLKSLRLRSRESKDTLVGVLFDGPDSGFRGILDFAFDKWAHADSDLKEGLDYYSAKVNLDGFSFEVPAPIWKIIEAKYKRKIKSLDSRIEEILSGITNFQKVVPESSLQVTYELSSTGGVYSPRLIQDGHYGLVSKPLVDNLRKAMDNFHNTKTKGEFKK